MFSAMFSAVAFDEFAVLELALDIVNAGIRAFVSASLSQIPERTRDLHLCLATAGRGGAPCWSPGFALPADA